MNTLPKPVKLYVTAVLLAALGFSFYLAPQYGIPDTSSFLLFVFLSIVVESMAVPLPNDSAVSVGYAIGLAVMIIQGPLATALCCSIGVAFRVLKLSDGTYSHIGNTPLYKTLFNGSQCFLSIGVPSVIYYAFNTQVGDRTFYLHIIPLLIALTSYLIINTTIITVLFSILSKESFWHLFMNNFKWTLPNSFIIATLGIFISLLYLNYGSIIMLLFFGPLLLARHSFKLYLDMKKLYMESVYALSKAVEAKDPYTNGHSQRVSNYAQELGAYLQLTGKQINNLRTAALLHDIGKIGIADSILNKPAKLSELEMHKIKSHPSIGIEILNDVYFFNEIKSIIYQHHERFDGKGYPQGLSGDAVQIEAYVLSVADAFDAMTSDRSYRRGMTPQQAMAIIEKETGQQFHPLVAKGFIEMLHSRKDLIQCYSPEQSDSVALSMNRQ